MLYKSTVAQRTLDLIVEMCRTPCLDNFFLVGGTALSLQTGNRLSVDIDFFTAEPFDANVLDKELSAVFSFNKLYIAKNTLKGTINDVFIDLMTHQYSQVKPLNTEENIRMASVADISAMKLNAIIGNGSRLKDFVDIAFCSSVLCLRDMMNTYKVKYADNNEIIILKALLFFNDIDFEVKIDLPGKNFDWEKISKRVEQMVSNPNKIFPSL